MTIFRPWWWGHKRVSFSSSYQCSTLVQTVRNGPHDDGHLSTSILTIQGFNVHRSLSRSIRQSPFKVSSNNQPLEKKDTGKACQMWISWPFCRQKLSKEKLALLNCIQVDEQHASGSTCWKRHERQMWRYVESSTLVFMLGRTHKVGGLQTPCFPIADWQALLAVVPETSIQPPQMKRAPFCPRTRWCVSEPALPCGTREGWLIYGDDDEDDDWEATIAGWWCMIKSPVMKLWLVCCSIDWISLV